MFVSRDVLQQIVEDLAPAILRAAGLRRSDDMRKAEDVLLSALRDFSGGPLDMIESVDASTAASLLGDPKAVFVYADFLAERGRVRSGLGRIEAARTDLERAITLYEKAHVMGLLELEGEGQKEKADSSIDAAKDALRALEA